MTEPPPIVLDTDAVEQLAQRIAELVAEQLRTPAPAPAAPTRSGELLTAAQLAERLEVDRSWVYDNATRLGALKLGTGRRPRLRFDPAIVAAALGLPTNSISAETSPVSESTAIPRGRT